MTPIRLAIVVSHPIQHFCVLYRALATDPSLNVHVLFASTAGARAYFDPQFNRTIEWKADLTGGYPHEFLPGARDRQLAGSVDCPGLKARLDALGPDVVQMYGFHHGISRRAAAWALRRGRCLLYIADSELRSRVPRLARLRKRLTLPLLFGLVDGFLTVGDCNEAYYKEYGVHAGKLFRCPFPIDDRAFDAALRDRAQARRRLRAAWGIPQESAVALVVGKLTRHKAPEHAIEAVARLRESGRAAPYLVLAGDGPERQRLEVLARSRCPELVRFPGFVNLDRLPDYYVASDFLVHPSSADPHPLATTEAVYCGLPVIASDRVGSVGPTDDVRHGVNGIAYPYGDIGALSTVLCDMASDEQLRRTMANRSHEIGQRRTLAACARAYAAAVTTCARRPRAPREC